eukprot:3323577-Rhodomonas_salina.2
MRVELGGRASRELRHAVPVVDAVGYFLDASRVVQVVGEPGEPDARGQQPGTHVPTLASTVGFACRQTTSCRQTR